MGYPDSDAECKILLNRSGKNPLDSVNCIVSKIEFLEMQSEVQNVFVSDDMARYIVSLISATRKHPLLSRGASPRATLSLTDMAKAVAFAEGRDYIVPRDVQNIFICTVNHRIILNAKASASKRTAKKFCTKFSEKLQNRGLENDKEHNNLSLSADGNIFVQHFLLRLVLMVFVPDGCFNSDNLAFAEPAFYDTECTLRY